MDLAKAAKLLGDIKASEREADLSGVDVIDAEQDFLKEIGQQVQEQAQVGHSKYIHAVARHLEVLATLFGNFFSLYIQLRILLSIPCPNCPENVKGYNALVPCLHGKGLILL